MVTAFQVPCIENPLNPVHRRLRGQLVEWACPFHKSCRGHVLALINTAILPIPPQNDNLSPTFVTSTQHVVKRTLASESPEYPLRCRTRSQYVTGIVHDGDNNSHLLSSPCAEDTSGLGGAPGKSRHRGRSMRRVEAHQGPPGGKGRVYMSAGP
jgi:hypothetical protein